MSGAIGDHSWSVEGLARFLRARHPAKTAACVEAETGVSALTVRKWLAGEVAPSLGAVMKLVGAYGPDVLAAMFEQAPRWLDAAVRAERVSKLKAERARLRKELDRLDERGAVHAL